MILEGIYLLVEETVIRKETDFRFDAVWKVIDVQEEEEQAKDGPLWDSRIHRGCLRGGTFKHHSHGSAGQEGGKPLVKGSSDAIVS